MREEDLGLARHAGGPVALLRDRVALRLGPQPPASLENIPPDQHWGLSDPSGGDSKRTVVVRLDDNHGANWRKPVM